MMYPSHHNSPLKFDSIYKRIVPLLLLIYVLGSPLKAQTIYDTPGTYTFNVPAGVSKIKVECWGAGGGGSNITSSGRRGGGGGGGAYASSIIMSPASSYSLTVGAGGSGSAIGKNGGNSSFNTSTIIAVGGRGGAPNDPAAGLGATANESTGDSKTSGGNGANGGSSLSGGGGGGAGSTASGSNAVTSTGGAGGSLWGGAGGNGVSGSAVGISGNVYAAGGSGAVTNNSTDRNGGTGANGLIIVTAYVVQVNATLGTPQESYATLKDAFDAINSGMHRGVITIKIFGSTTETTSAILNQSGSGSASYTSILIYPENPDVTISGNFDGALLNLNGADNVTINGSLLLTNAFPTMTFVNNHTGTSASTVFFGQDASSNQVSYTIIKGAAASATSGVVVLSTGAATGNDNNTIEFCKISGTGNTAATRPFNAIFSSGNSGKENSGNLFSNNDIFDFLNHANESSGIRLDAFTTNCTISGNNFYETTTFTTTSAVAHRAIYLNHTSGVFTIQGNFIGGNSAKASGVWTKNGNDNDFYGIYLNVSSATASSIQGNAIRNMDYTNSADTTWTGIYVKAGKAHIGTIIGDTIGNGVGTNSIVFKNATATGALYGIYVASTDSVLIHNTTIGSITTNNTNAANSTGLFGIYKANVAGAVDIQNNTIGGPTTPNSLYASSLATGSIQHIMGVYSGSTTGSNIHNNQISNLSNATTSAQISLTRGIRTANGVNIITDNKVHDLSSLSTNGANFLSAQLVGIDQVSISLVASHLVQGNTVFALKNITDVKIEMYGIFFRSPSTVTSIINRNFIHTYIIVSTNQAYLHGLSIELGACRVTNNVVFLGNNITTGCYIWGIWHSSALPIEFYHNTSYLSGQATTGTSNTYAFRDISNGATSRTIKNNIFWNARYNSNELVSHYALYFGNENGTLTLNYNDYQYTQGFAQISGATYATFSTLWRAGYDANSLNKDPLLTNLGGNQASDYQPGTTLDCQKLTEVDVDFGYQTRPTTATMGAWEFTANPVEIWKDGVKQNSYPNLKGAFDAINAGSYTGGLYVKITSNTNETAPVVLYNSGNTDGGRNSSYSYVVIHPTRAQIQVKGNIAGALVDLDGADNVRIDGRANLNGSTPELQLINTSVNSAATSLRFLNSAESDTIQYCYLKGSSPAATSAIVHLSTSASGNGNDNIIIRNCRITNPGIGPTARVHNALYSLGTTGRENSGVQITDNYFYDFRSESTNSNGILIDANSTDFTITGNSFYATSTMNSTANLTLRGIAIENATGNNFQLSGNFIGGMAPMCQGNLLGIGTLKARSLVYYPIYLNVGTTTATSVQGNLIANFHCYSTNAAPFVGIYLQAGAFNVGTVTGNVIGASTGTGNILLTDSLGGLATSYGIYVNTTGATFINNNTLGGITTSNFDATRGHSFIGIYKPNISGQLTINNNLIGSLTTTGSLFASKASTTDAQEICGIKSLGSGSVVINANTIANLKNGSTRSNASNSVYGIWIQNNGATQATLDRNFIYELSSSSTNTLNLAVGIYLSGGPILLSNNIISLGYGKTYNYFMLGLYDVGLAGQTSTLYHNTSYISGTYNSGTCSASYYKANNAGSSILQNNIFYNNTVSGTSRQYALYFANASGGGTLTVNNNDYYTTGLYTGYYQTVRKSGSIIVSGQDVNSQNVNPQFAFAYSIDRAGYKLIADLFGATGTGITLDHGLFTRSTTSPCLGAWERINKWKGSVSIDFNTPANWTAGTVPSTWDNVIFDESPIRPCFMDQQRYVTDIVNAQSAYRFILNGYTLNIKGQLVFSNSAQLDATATGSTLAFVGTVAQNLAGSSLLDNKLYNLVINNGSNVNLSGTLVLLNTITATAGRLNTLPGSTVEYFGTTQQAIAGNSYLNEKAYNITTSNPLGLLLNTNFTVDNNLNISTGSSLTIPETKTLTVAGVLTNNAGTGGLLLKSSALGTASLNQSNGGVPGTMQRYIVGDTLDWHFMSSPVSNQAISGSWTPAGGLADGVGYDLFTWDELHSCWVYKPNTTEQYTWASAHPESHFVSGRGYLYAIESMEQTNAFVGLLNGGTIARPITFTVNDTVSYDGFNLLGNPYPSTIDWRIDNGFFRSMLTLNGGGYDYWTWSTTSNNYGVYNSEDADIEGTNHITSYIAPMQAFFVRAATSGTFNFYNAARGHDSASVWLKSAKVNAIEQNVRLSVTSSEGRDEVKFGFGYEANEAGAVKLFSPVLTAPSLYLSWSGQGFTTRRLTDTTRNKYVPVNFKAGATGSYTLDCKYDASTLGTIYLEDRLTGAVLDLSGGESYTFQASTSDAPERFVLHFGAITPVDMEVHPNVWVSAGVLNVYLENMIGDYTMRVTDLNGRLVSLKKMSGSEQCSVSLFGRGIYLVTVFGADKSQSIKVVY